MIDLLAFLLRGSVADREVLGDAAVKTTDTDSGNYEGKK